MTVLVVDVSSRNHHPIDYAAARSAGVGGAVVELTEGAASSASVNPYAGDDVAGFRAAGVAVSGYQFLHPAAPVGDQLDVLRGNLHGIGFVWVDSELAEDAWIDVAAQTRAMCEAIADAGLKPGIHASSMFLARLRGAPWGFPLWVYDHRVPSLPRPAAMWQYTDAGIVPGIKGRVDLSRFYGTEDALAGLFGHGVCDPAAGTPPAVGDRT